MVRFPHLETERLLLRRFQEADLDPFMAYRNDPLVARYQSWNGITKAEARAFLAAQRVQEFGVPGQGIQIAIQRRDTGDLIGDLFLQIDPTEARQAELGFTLASEHQGQGFATEAVRCLLDFAFPSLHLHRIIAVVDCRNAASFALLERLRFRREATFLQSYWDNDRWTDEYQYAMLEEEWREREVDCQCSVTNILR